MLALALPGAVSCTSRAEVLPVVPAQETRLPGGTPVLELGFDDAAVRGPLGEGPVPLRNAAEVPIETRLATVADAVARLVPGPGGGQALRLPPYAMLEPRGAVLVVTTPGDGDLLSPGTRDFTFGADFVLDQISEEGGFDNGNNLVQRGLFADQAQYKLQVEDGRVSCRVQGSAGEVVVESDEMVEPTEWYRVVCSRLGDVVVLELGPLDGEARRMVASGATGEVRLSSSTVLAVGGKVSATGEAVQKNSDQFNGRIDNVFLEVGALL